MSHRCELLLKNELQTFCTKTFMPSVRVQGKLLNLFSFSVSAAECVTQLRGNRSADVLFIGHRKLFNLFLLSGLPSDISRTHDLIYQVLTLQKIS